MWHRRRILHVAGWLVILAALGVVELAMAPTASPANPCRAAIAANASSLIGTPRTTLHGLDGRQMAAMARATGWMPANVLRPFQVGNARTSHDGPSRRYMNFLDADEGTRVHDAYGDATYERLAEIKAKYDPDNVFHHNQNIRPAGRTS
jgi:hypothetical protein